MYRNYLVFYSCVCSLFSFSDVPVLVENLVYYVLCFRDSSETITTRNLAMKDDKSLQFMYNDPLLKVTTFKNDFYMYISNSYCNFKSKMFCAGLMALLHYMQNFLSINRCQCKEIGTTGTVLFRKQESRSFHVILQLWSCFFRWQWVGEQVPFWHAMPDTDDRCSGLSAYSVCLGWCDEGSSPGSPVRVWNYLRQSMREQGITRILGRSDS